MVLYLITPNICDYAVELQIDAASLVPPSKFQFGVLEQTITHACMQLHIPLDQSIGRTTDAMIFVNNNQCDAQMWNDNK